MTDPTPPIEQTKQRDTAANEPDPRPSVASTGKRQAFQDLKRQLTEQDLSNPGTQKLILEMLSIAEADRDECKGYVDEFHRVDKEAAVLREKLRGDRLNELMFTVGVGVGCAAIGLAPFFWDKENNRGLVCLVIGAVLVAVFSVLRAVRVVLK